MDEQTKVTTVQMLVGEDPTATNEVCSVYLSVAAEKMLRRLYPFDTTQTEVPAEYAMTQCELAARLIQRRGAEGEIAHHENGINRSYGSVNDEDILSRLTPYAQLATKQTEATE